MHGEDPQDNYRKKGRKNIRKKHKTDKSKMQAQKHTEQNGRGAPRTGRGEDEFFGP